MLAAGMTCYNNAPPPVARAPLESQVVDPCSVAKRCTAPVIDLFG